MAIKEMVVKGDHDNLLVLLVVKETLKKVKPLVYLVYQDHVLSMDYQDLKDPEVKMDVPVLELLDLKEMTEYPVSKLLLVFPMMLEKIDHGIA